jgi:hypothetical protein
MRIITMAFLMVSLSRFMSSLIIDDLREVVVGLSLVSSYSCGLTRLEYSFSSHRD